MDIEKIAAIKKLLDDANVPGSQARFFWTPVGIYNSLSPNSAESQTAAAWIRENYNTGKRPEANEG